MSDSHGSHSVKNARWKLPTRFKSWLASCALVVLVAIVYWPTLTFDFVNWDDPWYVINNPLIRSWQPSNLWKIGTEIAVLNFAPITIFSYLVDYTVWGGLNPGGFHLTNVLLHAVNAVLVYHLVSRLSQNSFVGWTTAALFALHPVQIETVAWIASRKGLLSGMFIFAALLCWLRPQRTGKQELLGIGFFVLALLSKAIAVVVPAIVLLYDIWVRRDSFAKALSRQFVPGLLAVWLLLVTMSAQKTAMGGIRGHFELNKAEILAVDSVILWRYVGMLAAPTDLCVLYDPPTQGIVGSVVLASLSWLVVVLAAYRCRIRYPLITWALTTSLILLLPVLNLFPITTLMNDRYLYLPSIPLFALAAVGMLRLLKLALQQISRFRNAEQSRVWTSRLAWTCGLSAVFVYGLLAQRHLPVWRNGHTLWNHATQHVPHLAVVQIQLANLLHDEGDDAQAKAQLLTALTRCRPDPADRVRILKKLNAWSK